MSRPGLPDFLNPPVVEVALSFQFETLEELRAIHLGALWEAFGRQQFPIAEEQPPVPPTFERLGIAPLELMPQFEILNIPPLPRYFFISKSGTEVIQIQNDRFAFNWRKGGSGEAYPRFELLLERFRSHAAVLVEFLRAQNLGALTVTQAELTYVNDIKAEALPGKLEKVVSVLSGEYSDEGLGDPEETRLSLRYPMYNDKQFLGRLYVDVRPSAFSENEAGINLVLFTRGKPLGIHIDAVSDFLRTSRATIVTAFASITSAAMHKTWGRTDNA